jgi:membrane fusion protein (multidrug efflux system)
MADADPKLDRARPELIAVNTVEQVEPDVPATRRRNWVRIAAMLSVPLLILAVGGYFWLTSGRYVSTDNAYVEQDMVSISPDVTGRIVEVRVKENQQVKAGDILFRIDPEPYRIALDQANAALAGAHVQVSTMSTDVGGAAADILSAQADIDLAQATYDRQAALMKRGFTTRASLDAAQHELSASRARLAKNQADAARAHNQIGSGTGTSGTPAAIQAALAQRDKAALELARTVVRAPKNGTVSQTGRLQVGIMTPTGVPALSLVVSQAAWVEANYKETDLNHMAVGQPATIKLDAYPGLKVRGHIASIGAGTGSQFSVLPAQNASGNWVKVTQRIPVRVAIDGNPSRAMIAGLSATVRVDTKAERD